MFCRSRGRSIDEKSSGKGRGHGVGARSLARSHCDSPKERKNNLAKKPAEAVTGIDATERLSDVQWVPKLEGHNPYSLSAALQWLSRRRKEEHGKNECAGLGSSPTSTFLHSPRSRRTGRQREDTEMPQGSVPQLLFAVRLLPRKKKERRSAPMYPSLSCQHQDYLGAEKQIDESRKCVLQESGQERGEEGGGEPSREEDVASSRSTSSPPKEIYSVPSATLSCLTAH